MLAQVRTSGARAGLALKPRTPFHAAEPFLEGLDLLLVMTVEPGFGGQAFMEDMVPKIRAAATWRKDHGARWLIEVDGGIGLDTAPLCRQAGADVFVAGHAVFRAPDPRGALAALRDEIASTIPQR
jgi:ribulose-phosphate 3-epimerase